MLLVLGVAAVAVAVEPAASLFAGGIDDDDDLGGAIINKVGVFVDLKDLLLLMLLQRRRFFGGRRPRIMTSRDG